MSDIGDIIDDIDDIDPYRLEVAEFANLAINLRYPAGLIGRDGALYHGDYFFDLVLERDDAFEYFSKEMLSVSDVEGAA